MKEEIFQSLSFDSYISENKFAVSVQSRAD